MLYLLDTNHVTVLDRGGDNAIRLSERLDKLEPSSIAVSIVTYEEQMRGWLAHIHKAKSMDRQAAGYQRLEQMLEFYCGMSLLPFSGTVLDVFQ
jgi:tRNA(fMet)-specific endonuclease VapC